MCIISRLGFQGAHGLPHFLFHLPLVWAGSHGGARKNVTVQEVETVDPNHHGEGPAGGEEMFFSDSCINER